MDIVNDSIENVFENWTDNNFTLSGRDEEEFHISLVSHIINAVISLLTVIFNSIVLYCLRTHRAKIPDVIFTQTLCLSVTDLLAGLAPATFFLTLFESIYRSGDACIFIISGFSAAQFAVLLNLCVLSVRRWIVLRNAAQATSVPAHSPKSAKLIIICPWLISFACHLPAVLVRIVFSERSTANGCVSPSLFENRKRLIAFCSLYMGALFLLNLFYISSLIALKRLPNINNGNRQSRGQRLQWKAFKNLLVVLVIANTTTLPLIAMLILMNVEIDRNPKLKFLLIQLPAVNSLVNPILYSIQISEIRGALRQNVSSLLNGIRKLFRANNTQ